MFYGIKNAYYCTKDGSPVRLPGAVGLNVDNGVEYITKRLFNSDGVIIEKPVAVTEGASSISLQIADLPITFLTDLFGYKINKDNVLIEYMQRDIVPFTLLFETTTTNSGKCRALYYECYCKKPNFNVSTVEETVKLEARSLDIIATGNPMSASITETQNKDVFDNWFEKVYKC